MHLYDYLNWKKRAHLMSCGTDKWWLAPGMDEEDCLAAYLFMGVDSYGDAKIDLTGHGYDLTRNTGQWDSDTGMSIGYPDDWQTNQALFDYDAVKAMIVGYTVPWTGSEEVIPPTALLSTGNYTYDRRFYLDWDPPRRIMDTTVAPPVMTEKAPHIKVLKDYTLDEGFTVAEYRLSLTAAPYSGVVGANHDGTHTPQIYINGTASTVIEEYGTLPVNRDAIFREHVGEGDVTFHASVFYKRTLTAAEHAYVAGRIAEFMEALP